MLTMWIVSFQMGSPHLWLTQVKHFWSFVQMQAIDYL